MSKSSNENRRQAHLDNNTDWEPITKVKSLQKNRPGRRRYPKPHKKIRRPPSVESSDDYYND